MNTKFRTVFSVIVLLLVVWAVVATVKPNEIKSQTVKIGALLPLSGKLANLGEDIRNSLELARKQVNEKLGIDIEMIYEDSAADPKVALSSIQKLVNDDKVEFVIAGPGSSGNLAVAPFVEQNKVVFIALSATPKLNTAGEYIFKIIPDIDDEVTIMAKWFKEQGLNNIAFIYDSSADSNVVGKDIFLKEFKKIGGGKVFVDGYDVKTTNDFRTIMTKVKSEKVDAVYFLGTDISSALAVKQAREIGLTQKIIGWSPTESEVFLQGAGKAAEGFIITTFPFTCAGADDMKQFCADYAKLYPGRTPLHYGAHAHDVLSILAVAIKMNTNRATLKDEIRAVLTSNSYKGLTGDLDFDANGNVVHKNFIFRIVKDGKFVDMQ